MSAFETLNKKDVGEHIERKNGLSYLSWAWAWQELKKEFPDANCTVYETPDGCIYWTDGKTAWVKTGVTVEGVEHIEYLPVMNYKNKSIPLEDITSMDVNTAIQRSITKAIARHGLGLYIYAGEDLPEEAIKESKTRLTAKRKVIADACAAQKSEKRPDGFKPEEILSGKKLDDLGESELDAVIKTLHDKKWIA